MRQLRFGMVGGGNGGFIGKCHRIGAQMDDLAVLVAGCFSRDNEKNKETAAAWNVLEDRCYVNYEQMAIAESAREDGIDFVVIVTPNDTHYAIAKCFMEHGIHVMCDKPLAISIPEAEELEKISNERGILFGLTYTYTGYPILRQAREMIRDGAIGDIIHVKVGHPEDWVYESVDEQPGQKLPWRFDPKRVGPAECTGDVGTHAEQLLVQFTGLRIRRVLAMFDKYPTHLLQETNVTALLDLGDGITGDLWASQIAVGKGCDAYIYVIGTKGALEWHHEKPAILQYHQKGKPSMIYDAGRPYIKEESLRITHASPDHHDGYLDAFSHIYRSYAEVLLAKLEGREAPDFTFPTIRDGVDGVRFVAACAKSQAEGNVWVDLRNV